MFIVCVVSLAVLCVLGVTSEYTKCGSSCACELEVLENFSVSYMLCVCNVCLLAGHRLYRVTSDYTPAVYTHYTQIGSLFGNSTVSGDRKFS